MKTIELLAEEGIDPSCFDNGILYRIVKYRPWGYDKKTGFYSIDEWTDVSDIGKTFDGVKLTLEDYLKVEDSFVSFMTEIMLKSRINFVTIVRWNDHTLFQGLNEQLAKSSKELISSFDEIKTGNRYSIARAAILFRLTLRNVIDAGFINERHNLFFHISFDYYLHLYCPLDYKDLLNSIAGHNLYLDFRWHGFNLEQIDYDRLKAWLHNDTFVSGTTYECASLFKGDKLDIFSFYGFFEICNIICQYRKKANNLLCVPVKGTIHDKEMSIGQALKTMDIDYSKAFLLKSDNTSLSQMIKLKNIGVRINYKRGCRVYIKDNIIMFLL